MPKLSFSALEDQIDNIETDDVQEAFTAFLGLSEEQSIELFANKGKITITKEQASKVNDFEFDADDGGDGANKNDDRSAEASDKEDVANAIDISVASQRDRDAVTVGELVSEKSLSIITGGYDAREKVNVTPLLFMVALRADFKAKKQDLGALPFPGSHHVKGIGTIVGDIEGEYITMGNEPFDKFVYYTDNDKGNRVKKNGSYYDRMMASTALGKKLIADEEQVTKAIASTVRNSGVECPAEYKGMTRVQLQRRKKLFESRFKFGRDAVLKKAIKLHRQCDKFDALTNIVVTFDTEKDKEGKEYFVNRNEPITLHEIKTVEKNGKDVQVQTGDGHLCTIMSFLKYDVAEAVKAAGEPDKVTLDHLTATVARETQQPGDKKADADAWSKHEIENVRQLENIMSSLCTYLSQGDDVNTKHVAQLEKRFAEKDGKEALVVFGDTALAIDDLWTRFEKPYRAAKRETTPPAATKQAA